MAENIWDMRGLRSILKESYEAEYYAVRFDPFDFSLCADFTTEFYLNHGYVLLDIKNTKDPRTWTKEEFEIYQTLYG